MMSSPLAKGLFHRGICESGTALAILNGKPLVDIENSGEALFKKLGIHSSLDPLEQARAVPFTKIIEANQAIETPRTPGNRPAPGTRPVFVWDAAVDGWFLPESPENTFKSGVCNAISLIVSANLGELTGPGMLVMPFIVPAYVEMLKSVTQQGYNGYACIFDQVPSSWREEGGVAVHAIELPYVFGDWDDSTGWWTSIAMLAQQQPGAKKINIELTDTDRIVSKAMMELWTSFARTGIPEVKGVINWPAYSVDTDMYLYIAGTLEVKSGFSKVAQ
jgi:carboxylesterase type B